MKTDGPYRTQELTVLDTLPDWRHRCDWNNPSNADRFGSSSRFNANLCRPSK